MEKKKILLFGATGMAGHIVYYYLKNTGKYDISNVVFRTKLTEDSIVVDVTNKAAVEQTIRQNTPDIIINCIGVLVKGSQNYPDNAILINAYFPHLLERLSSEVGAKLIHISTDCVFSGKKGAYKEDDFKDADDVYGRSKALGEINNGRDLTIRTSIIGPELKTEGEGLFHWFRNQEGDINGYTEAFWGGVTTLELAKAIALCLEQNIVGLVHLTNGQKISKYDLLKLFKEIWKRDNAIIPYLGKSIDKSLEKSDRVDFSVPSYEKMLEDQFNWMITNRELYNKVYIK